MEPDVQVLIEHATGSASSATRALARYRSGEWTLFGYETNTTVVGVIGAETGTSTEVIIRSVAVDPLHRARGIGRRMVRAVALRFPEATLVAETDEDAVRFYERCGFAIESLGEKYPGAERFRCTLPRPDPVESA